MNWSKTTEKEIIQKEHVRIRQVWTKDYLDYKQETNQQH